MQPDILEGFQKPNPVDDTEALFGFLDAVDRMGFIQACKSHMLALAPPMQGQRVLDIGCGLGHEVQRLATLVGETGRVVGVDHGEKMIREARRRAVGLPVEFQVADAHALEFPDGTFDLSRAERVVEYVAQPAKVIAEMTRVVCPGGTVVVFDFDYEGLVVDYSDRVVLRAIKKIFYNSVPHGSIGTQLPALFRDCGMSEVRVVPVMFTPPLMVFERLLAAPLQRAATTGVLEGEIVDAWWRALREASEDQRFFAAIPGFVVAGKK